ncbi:uncharacterized protein LOC111632298 [Centruroides sculpturatus]|uniref:uncharacterized protein LOC111632298 n=1 Tax=Centruroides sculpturatus TaxID=218467 RepID=UPI000C6E2E27|nr:uncharacterized protein LOC111632298 [Centruroides sculpturatus]
MRREFSSEREVASDIVLAKENHAQARSEKSRWRERISGSRTYLTGFDISRVSPVLAEQCACAFEKEYKMASSSDQHSVAAIKEKLINNVYLHPEIWDKRLPDHRNRNIIHTKWNEIAEATQLDVSKCKKLWKNLCDQFRAIHNSLPRSGSGLEATKPKWIFYPQLQFLADVVEARVTHSNVVENETNENIQLTASEVCITFVFL